MPTRTTAPTGAPCWIDLQTSDPEASRSFYTALFGWTALEASPEFGGYFMFTLGDVPVAGCMPSDEQAPVRDIWSVYLATPDVAKTLDLVTGAQGQVVVPAMPVADLGTMAFALDAGKAGVGLWQAGSFHGFTRFGEPNTPSWFELRTRDYTDAVSFYRDVFGWDTHVVSDSADFRYTTLVDPAGDGWLAGIADAAGWLPEGVPAHWAVYFGVADTDAALEKVVELGGTVLEPAEDTPYGRLAGAADSTGARFRLVAANELMPPR